MHSHEHDFRKTEESNRQHVCAECNNHYYTNWFQLTTTFGPLPNPVDGMASASAAGAFNMTNTAVSYAAGLEFGNSASTFMEDNLVIPLGRQHGGPIRLPSWKRQHHRYELPRQQLGRYQLLVYGSFIRPLDKQSFLSLYLFSSLSSLV